jgi:hypothetical protein
VRMGLRSLVESCSASSGMAAFKGEAPPLIGQLQTRTPLRHQQWGWATIGWPAGWQ